MGGVSRQSVADRPGTATSSAQAVVSTPAQPSPPSPPKPTLSFEERRAAAEAVTALRALKSATSVGVVYSEYMRRLADAKIMVDRSSSALVKSPLRAQFDDVMSADELVGSARDAKIQKYDLEGYLRRPRDCQPYEEEITLTIV